MILALVSGLDTRVVNSVIKAGTEPNLKSSFPQENLLDWSNYPSRFTNVDFENIVIFNNHFKHTNRINNHLIHLNSEKTRNNRTPTETSYPRNIKVINSTIHLQLIIPEHTSRINNYWIHLFVHWERPKRNNWFSSRKESYLTETYSRNN